MHCGNDLTVENVEVRNEASSSSTENPETRLREREEASIRDPRTDGEPDTKKIRTEPDVAEPEAKKIRRESDDPMQTPIAKALLRVDIAEVYSPTRVTGYAEKYGLKPGEAMDLTTGWDFRRKEHRETAIEYVRRVKPSC